MSDRLCARGCGRSLAGRRKNTRYCGAVECRDNARRAEEAACSTTTIETTSRSAAASGSASLPSRSGCWVNPCPPPVGTRRSCSSVSATPSPLSPSQLRLAPTSEAITEAQDEWRDAQARRDRRTAPRRGNRTYQCPSCKAFKSGPSVTCGGCGYDPGYGWAA